MANDLYLGMVVDKSGSMSPMKTHTILAFNEYLKARKAEEGETTVWLSTFNSGITPINEGVPISEVSELNTTNYVPAGGTALYDAIGTTINKMTAAIKADKFKGKVLFFIQTDGQENTSIEYTKEMVFDLISKKQNKKNNWTFIFVGADKETYTASASLGVSQGNTVVYNTRQTLSTMKTVSDASNTYRNSAAAGACLSFFNEDDKSKIEVTS